ncbi:aspartate/glutamate racemase family protein [Tateyamaria omphalii]|uniref:maleate cis-trans isomerase family protein n=1 Tax=Tateyamaria omphalii TaxID=299262 RepID=UPI001C99E246|nr:Asp/Glu racemase [Tateyamaria omphalii]MBY5935242.1 aspartate/glutamate racemase family protein [Tateyamaria omphalii]
MSVPYDLDPHRTTQLGLIVLQADETIEQDMRRLLPDNVECMVSRVPSGTSVTPATLQDMAAHLTDAAHLLPRGADMACVAYACTSGTAEIGADRIRELVRDGVSTPHVTDPVTALIAACRHLGISRLGLLSPYIASVSDRLRSVLAASGIDVVAFAGFDEPVEERVVRISSRSVIAAAESLGRDAQVDALFLSCTNLRTLDAIPAIEAARGIPVLSSNLVLAWHMAQLAGEPLDPGLPFRLAIQAATRAASSR